MAVNRIPGTTVPIREAEQLKRAVRPSRDVGQPVSDKLTISLTSPELKQPTLAEAEPHQARPADENALSVGIEDLISRPISNGDTPAEILLEAREAAEVDTLTDEIRYEIISDRELALQAQGNITNIAMLMI